MADVIPQAMQNGEISSIEFQEAMQVVERNRKLRTDIINQSKTKVRHKRGKNVFHKRGKKRVFYKKSQMRHISTISMSFKA